MDLSIRHGLDLDRALADADTPVLLVITQAGCGACRSVKAALATLAPLPGLLTWEVEAGTAPALVEELEIFHLPALWLFSGGEPVAEVQAEAQPVALGRALSAALGTALGAAIGTAIVAPPTAAPAAAGEPGAHAPTTVSDLVARTSANNNQS